MLATHRRQLLLTIVLPLLFAILSRAQEIPAQNLGSQGLWQALTRLKTTARLLHSTAHPDDDDGSMLTYESRGEGATTLMLTLNRGEGGQNKVGSELFDQLGVLRTLELLEADRYYGVEQRFTHVVDFGFSKNPAETFAKWGGHDTALADMVRVIRSFRPDVIVSRFVGNDSDGHGNHQAAAILSREAFRAAADPSRFPEQIREGLLPWQVKKLYTGNLRDNEKDFTFRMDTGAYDPVLGMSYLQLSIEGLKHQASQGVGGANASSGPNFRGYKLLDSVLSPAKAPEKSFFDGIDTTIPGLASRIGEESEKVPFLLPELKTIQQDVDDAFAAFDIHDPSRTAPALLDGLSQVRDLLQKVVASPLSAVAKLELETHLRTKEQQFQEAANLALGTQLTVAVDSGEQRSASLFFPQEQTFLMAVPGQSFTVTAKFFNRGSQAVLLKDIILQMPAGWRAERLKADFKQLLRNQSGSAQFRITVPQNAEYTRPYWKRDSDSQNVYQILDSRYATLPLPPWPLRARATYTLPPVTVAGSASPGTRGEGSIDSVVQVKLVDPLEGQLERPLAVGPPVSVDIEDPVRVVSTKVQAPVNVIVDVRNHVHGPAQAQVRLNAPPGWQVQAEDGAGPLRFTSENELKTVHYRLLPPKLEEARYDLSASAEYNGKSYAEAVSTIGRKDIGFFYYYRPAKQQISAVDVSLPENLRVGYLMGAGDNIPDVLRQIGIPVTLITPDQLAHGDLTQFDTIVIGIRAYDVRSDIREYNSRLLDFVNRGGTLVVQYNSSTVQFNAGHYTPYPASLNVPERRNPADEKKRSAEEKKPKTPPQSDRVTDEDAPVEVLVPNHPVLNYPNRITQRDFQGWVQERGLYFMKQWDPHYEALLASHDPGEAPLKGGLLVAPYGKGTYVFTGYAFFRQLPAGVPGAIRLFVNLVSAGHNQPGRSAAP